MGTPHSGESSLILGKIPIFPKDREAFMQLLQERCPNVVMEWHAANKRGLTSTLQFADKVS